MSLTVSTKPKLVAAEPELFVADISASCAFFTRKLGFSIAFTYGEPPFYAQVKRDGAALNLKCVERPVIDPDLRDREQLRDRGGQGWHRLHGSLRPVPIQGARARMAA